MEKKDLRAAFAWGLIEDADDYTHLKALTSEMKAIGKRYQDAELNTPSAPLSSSHYKDEL